MMKSVSIEVIVITLAILLGGCQKNPIPDIFLNKIEGQWIEIYHCGSAACHYPNDSLLSSEILFTKDKFSSAFYTDSLQSICDTSFSGRYSVSSDTIELILDNFSEVFYYNLSNENDLYLNAVYSIDSKGNKIIDFRSVLWCCDRKKRGTFTKQ